MLIRDFKLFSYYNREYHMVGWQRHLKIPEMKIFFLIDKIIDKTK